MRYFTKLTVEYCRIFVINCIFAAVIDNIGDLVPPVAVFWYR